MTIEYIDYMSTRIFPLRTSRFTFGISGRVQKKLDSAPLDDVIVFSIDSEDLTEICKNNRDLKIKWHILNNDAVVDGRIFAGSYNVHQIFVSRSLLGGSPDFAMEFVFEGASPDRALDVKIDVGTGNFSAIVDELEEKYIWIFGSPRAGTTWLAHDVLGAIPSFHKKKADEFVPGSRPIDEMNIGRLVGSFELEPEHYMNLDTKIFAKNENDFPCGADVKQNDVDNYIFKRSVIQGYGRDESIFNERTYDMFIKNIKEMIFMHIAMHWGVEGYERVVLKAPNEGHAADFLLRATPRSRAIHLVRDGRDVIRSRFSPFASKILAETQDSRLRMNAVSYYAHQWNWHTDIVRKSCADHAEERVLTVRYEDLRKKNITDFRNVMKFAGYEIDDDQVRGIIGQSALESFADDQKGPSLPRQGGRIGGFRDAFNDLEKTTMTAIMVDNLTRYGYDTKIEPDELQANYRSNHPVDFPGVRILYSDGFFEDKWIAKNASFVLHVLEKINNVRIEFYLPDQVTHLLKEAHVTIDIKNRAVSHQIKESGTIRIDCVVEADRDELIKMTIACGKSYEPSKLGNSADLRKLCMILTGITVS